MTSNNLFRSIRKYIENNNVGKEEFQIATDFWEKLINSEDGFNYTVSLMTLLSKYKIKLTVDCKLCGYKLI